MDIYLYLYFVKIFYNLLGQAICNIIKQLNINSTTDCSGKDIIISMRIYWDCMLFSCSPKN